MNNFSEVVNRLNDEAVETLIPAVVFIVILMIIGIIGNPAIVYFYGFKLRPTPSYMFIVALAVFDFVGCAVSMPLELVDLIRFYTFESAVTCKLLRFVNYLMAISSGSILIAIAVDRYRKICKPFESQITIKMAKIIIPCILFGSVCVSWPSFVFYTVVQVNLTEVAGAVGQDCTTRRDDSYKLYITLYNGILFLVFIIAITSLIVLYCLVGKQIFNLRSFRFYAQRKRTRSSTRPQSGTTQYTEETGGFGSFRDSDSSEIAKFDEVTLPPSRGSSRPTTATAIAFTTGKVAPSPEDFERSESRLSNGSGQASAGNLRISRSLHNALKSDKVSVPPRSNSALSERTGIHSTNNIRNGSARTSNLLRQIQVRESSRVSFVEEGDQSIASTVETRDANGNADIDQKKTSAQNINTKKYTIIMLSITVAFIVSFLPYLALMTWRTLSKEYEPNLFSKSELVAFQIFIRSFLINSAVNPLIYGFLNTEFRNFVIACVCCREYIGPPQPRSENSGHSRSS
ncbi:cholecystokinin receptor type A-like [Saccostrea echinata]|uniref:cholecystokinin receptor type A-like n=1 Tax=Saccostrea echinata TaxID=191078 RepID=UPI002A7ED820|nr:cholecystokinin receptor type A-like [Saccostrea echinata]